jgi:hypothetical protein
MSGPDLIAISPIAQIALLQTEMNSGFRFMFRTCMKSSIFIRKICQITQIEIEYKTLMAMKEIIFLLITGLMFSKQALVRSPKRANELCLTSQTGSYFEISNISLYITK